LFLINTLFVTINLFSYIESIATTMARILILIFLVWLLYQIIKRVAANANTKSSAKASAKQEQSFIKCVQCGCHVPEAESQIINNKVTCNNLECITQQRNNTSDGA
jgi:threonine/homoserine/homoserine lactone efflux protein